MRALCGWNLPHQVSSVEPYPDPGRLSNRVRDMMIKPETVISVVSTASDRRIVVALSERSDRPVTLRTESFSSDVGWFAQQTLNLSRSELQALKSVLGVQLHRACGAALQALEDTEVADAPRVLSFERMKRA